VSGEVKYEPVVFLGLVAEPIVEMHHDVLSSSLLVKQQLDVETTVLECLGHSLGVVYGRTQLRPAVGIVVYAYDECVAVFVSYRLSFALQNPETSAGLRQRAGIRGRQTEQHQT